MKTVILGMGNTLFSDDGVGILIARKLSGVFQDNNAVDVIDTSWGGFRIIDLLSGYDYAIIIDAIKTGETPPGSIHRFRAADFIHSVRMVSFHDINFATALEFARQMEIPMPENISIYAIEVQETELMSEKITPAVRPAIAACIREIRKEIEKASYSTAVNKKFSPHHHQITKSISSI